MSYLYFRIKTLTGQVGASTSAADPRPPVLINIDSDRKFLSQVHSNSRSIKLKIINTSIAAKRNTFCDIDFLPIFSL